MVRVVGSLDGIGIGIGMGRGGFAYSCAGPEMGGCVESNVSVVYHSYES